MKNIIDKIILSFFSILCFIAFWCLVYDLPNLLLCLFNDEKANVNYTFISFVFCIFILGYVINYFYKIHSDNEHKKSIKTLLELQTVDTINKFDYSKLQNIKSIALDGESLKIILKNSITFKIPILNFHVVENQDILYDLDTFMNNQLKNPSIPEQTIYQPYLKNKLLLFLQNLENNIDKQ